MREGIWNGYAGTSEFYASRHGCGDSLPLPFANVLSFIFRDKGKNLQNQVGNESPDKAVLVVGSIQQRHVDNPDVYTLGPHEISPFFKDLCIIAPEAIKRLDDQQIARFKFVTKSLPGRSIEIFSAFLVGINIILVDIQKPQCVKLAGFVLIWT